MDYKERYTTALERAKERYSACSAPALLEYIFPELKESKEEKNIKDLIDELKCSLRAANCQNDACGGGHEKRIALLEWSIAWLEKQGEQKIADKTKPKFKVRDWLQYRYAEPFLVEEITEQGYCNGNSCLPFEWEDEIHPWTIQDAKDGDIVYYECHGNKHLFIVKSVGETKDHVEGHFWYDITRNEHEVWDGRLPYSNIASMRDAMPATKEQRDLLFAKMKEEGYYWDAKNNTLWQTK